MNKAKIVIALGGNALQSGNKQPTADAQLQIVKQTCERIAEIVDLGYNVTIVHGNGPQVGRILLASEAAKDITPAMPFDVCGAMSQGYIGYHLQQSLRSSLIRRSKTIPVVTVATQVIVDPGDSAFNNPTKPIGPFYSQEEAERIQLSSGYCFREDAGRGWRRVVASPVPQRIVEIEAIKALSNLGIVIACGGGGIPVVENADGSLDGVAAVIDKDYAAELLAEQLDADILLILTEVENVAINFNKPNQQNLSSLSLAEASRYCEGGEFAPGSMLPKIKAAMKFVSTFPNKKVIITALDKASDALEGKTGTVITHSC